MKQVSFNIDEFAFFSDMYDDTDHLNENEINDLYKQLNDTQVKIRKILLNKRKER